MKWLHAIIGHSTSLNNEQNPHPKQKCKGSDMSNVNPKQT